MNKEVLENIIGYEMIKEIKMTMHNQNTDHSHSLAHNSNTRYMSVNSAATYLDVSRRTIYRWIDKGLIPYSKIPSGYRFDVEEIDRWMKPQHVPEVGLPDIKEF